MGKLAQRAGSVAGGGDALELLEERLGYEFKRRELLVLALTHRSFVYEAAGGPGQDAGRNAPGTDNEQMEFLGDAVLGLAVTEALFREFPECSEGELTRMRAALVSRHRMAALGAALRLDEGLRLGRGAEAADGRRKPALLANAAEAVLAAMYLDAGPSGLDVVRGLIGRELIEPELPELRAAVERDAGRGALRDAKTLLQEKVQALAKALRAAAREQEGSDGQLAEEAPRLSYVDTGHEGPAHQRTFSVEVWLSQGAQRRLLAAGTGASKKEAQQQAAHRALERWNSSGSAADGALEWLERRVAGAAV